MTEYAVYKDLLHVSPNGEYPGKIAIGIPQVLDWFTTQPLWNNLPYHILVMENLGPDLGKLFKQHKRPFSTKTVLMLADQILQRIKFLHEEGYIHRDIKPGNFLMGLGKWENTVYLADFGLSKKNDAIYKENAGFTGTPKYASMNTHLGISQSRRDDMESIGYVLILFRSGCLPWQNLKQYEKMIKMKKRTTVENVCRECEVEFHMYLRYCRGLRFDEEPDYNYLRKLFNDLFYRLEHQYDWIFDWTTI